jgi:hypothetical protein
MTDLLAPAGYAQTTGAAAGLLTGANADFERVDMIPREADLGVAGGVFAVKVCARRTFEANEKFRAFFKELFSLTPRFRPIRSR